MNMPHFVFVTEDGKYISTRKNNGRMYKSRVTLSDTLDGARIFNTAGAATNSGNQAGEKGRARKISLSLDEVI